MFFTSNVASYIGLFLVAVGALLLCLINIFLGIPFLVFTMVVLLWYMRLKKKGDTYFRDVARLTGCRFKGGGTGYGCVEGVYKGRKMEVKVNSGYDSLRGFSGLALSYLVLDSMMGVLAGLKNFTSVKIENRKIIDKPYKLDDRTFVDKDLILYLPPCSEATGLPKISARKLVEKIDDILRRVG